TSRPDRETCVQGRVAYGPQLLAPAGVKSPAEQADRQSQPENENSCRRSGGRAFWPVNEQIDQQESAVELDASELSRAVEEKGRSIVCDACDKSRGNALQAYCSQ